MRKPNHLTVLDKLLLAAFGLEEQGSRPFSAEDLVVSAWQTFPDTFGLAGYRGGKGNLSYPDSNRVFAEVMGSKPIRKRGLLEKVGSKMYQLTEAGREHARLLLNRPADSDSKVEKAALARETEAELKRLLATKALEKAKDRREEDLTFYDACAFWRISPRSSAIELEGRLGNLERVVASAREVMKTNTTTFEHGGQAFSGSDLEFLLKMHAQLQQRFQDEIRIIRKRTDER
jgi:hypothetical protein